MNTKIRLYTTAEALASLIRASRKLWFQVRPLPYYGCPLLVPSL